MAEQFHFMNEPKIFYFSEVPPMSLTHCHQVLAASAAGVGYALPHSSILNHYSVPQLHLIQFVVALLWTGFVLAISFMEAPVKFRAQSLPKNIAVDVGRTVFWALNRSDPIRML